MTYKAEMKFDNMSKSERRQRVLFLCTHNSARSQMAEGILRAIFGDRYDAYSAGVAPTAVDPDAIRAMADIGIDISCHRSKGIGDLSGTTFDLVVTVCDGAREACPVYPGAARQIHRSFEDPAVIGPSEARLEAFRRVRDEIGAWIISEL